MAPEFPELCSLYWTRSFNLNFASFASGFGFAEVQVGPYLEGSFFNIPIIAKIYEPILFLGPPCPRRPFKYSIDLTEYQRSQGLSFDEDTGVLSGRILDVDQYVGEINPTTPFRADGPVYSYYPIATRPNPRRISFYVKAYFVDNPEEFIDGNFFIDISVNWDTKRRSLMIGPRKIESDFFIEGKPATNEQYYSYLISKNYI